jgi:hypothetical protein
MCTDTMDSQAHSTDDTVRLIPGSQHGGRGHDALDPSEVPRPPASACPQCRQQSCVAEGVQGHTWLHLCQQQQVQLLQEVGGSWR